MQSILVAAEGIRAKLLIESLVETAASEIDLRWLYLLSRNRPAVSQTQDTSAHQSSSFKYPPPHPRILP